MQYNNNTITHQGAAMLAKATAIGQSPKLDNIVVSQLNVPDSKTLDSMTLNDLSDGLVYPVNAVSQNDNSFTVVSVIDNEKVNSDFKANLVGVTAHLGGDSQLIAICQADSPFIIDKYNGTPISLKPAITIGFSGTPNVTLVVNNTNYLTGDDLIGYVTKDFYFSNMPKLPNNIVTGMPSNPPALECHMNNGSIAYTITPPVFYGRAEIEKYTLYYKADGDNDFSQITVSLDNLTGTISNIDLGQKYTLQATATNQMGESKPSTATTLITGNVPTNVKLAVNINSANATINWSATADVDSRTPVTSYTLYFRDTNSSLWKTTNDSSVTGFTYGHSYELKAVATNVVGDSDYSQSQTVIMATKPYNCQLTVMPDYANQSVSWSATAQSDYGLPIMSYTLYYRDVTTNGDWATTTDHTVTGLKLGYLYEFKATATNIVGDSDYSNAQNEIMVVLPVTPKAVLTIENGNLTAQISPNGNSTNVPSSYIISYTKNSKDFYDIPVSFGDNHIFEEVNSISDYIGFAFKVKAINSAGYSDYTDLIFPNISEINCDITRTSSSPYHYGGYSYGYNNLGFKYKFNCPAGIKTIGSNPKVSFYYSGVSFNSMNNLDTQYNNIQNAAKNKNSYSMYLNSIDKSGTFGCNYVYDWTDSYLYIVVKIGDYVTDIYWCAFDEDANPIDMQRITVSKDFQKVGLK